MNAIKHIGTIGLGIALQSLLMASPAFAFRGDLSGSEMMKATRNPDAGVRIKGALTCKQTGVNTGQACSMTIQDTNTGQIFRLSQSSKIMRLYENGTKNVAVEGKLTSADSIEVSRVEEL